MTQRPDDDFHPIRDGLWTRDPEEIARRRQQFGAHIARQEQHFEALNATQMRRDRAAERARIVAWFVVALAAGVVAAALVLHLAAGAAAAVADPMRGMPW